MPDRAKALFLCWILLTIASWVFNKRASYETKKKFHPVLAILIGVLVIGFAEAIFNGKLPWLFIVAICAIAFLQIRLTQFCSKCNATINPRGFSKAKVCPECGAELT